MNSFSSSAPSRLTVETQNDHNFALSEMQLARLVAAAQQTVALHPEDAATPSELTIVFATDDEIAELNRNFRGVDAPTDVLSFPADTPPIPEEETQDWPLYWGDLVIAYPYASAQAAREGHDLLDSLILLVVHGTLHLLGYDHDTQEARAEMWAVQDQTLDALGISRAIVPTLEKSDHA